MLLLVSQGSRVRGQVFDLLLDKFKACHGCIDKGGRKNHLRYVYVHGIH